MRPSATYSASRSMGKTMLTSRLKGVLSKARLLWLCRMSAAPALDGMIR